MIGNSIGSESITGEAVVDILFRSRLAEKIANDLLSYDSNDQISMLAIHGSWGSGKTHLLKHLGQIMASNGNLVVGLSAWMHEPEGELLASLLSALLDIDNYPWHQDDFALRERMLIHSLDREYLMALSDILTAAGQAWGPAKPMSSIIVAVYKLYQFISPERNWPSVKRIRGSFQTMINRVLVNKYSHIYIIVDDLDRCSPPAMIRFIESVKNLFSIESCTFILAFDYEAAALAITGQYNSYIESGGKSEFGKRYLAKVFEQSYSLPDPMGLDWLFVKQLDPNFKDVCEYLRTVHHLVLEFSDRELITKSFRESWFCNPRAAARSGAN